MRVLALVDGEHYPPVTRWGIEAASSRGYEVVGALLLGGTEKLRPGALPDLGVPVTPSPEDLAEGLAEAIDEVRPQAILDLSDEPVLGYRERMGLAAVALARGVPYVGPDFRLDPPISGPPLPVPTVVVIGTGKRTGKTAVGGEVARVAASLDLNPIVVAMGRGGPPEPQVARAGEVGLERLLELARAGDHAASDYLEDAVTTGVTTIGARRAGGGLAGAPMITNVRQGAELAVELGAGLVVLEGSGSAIPPVPWDAGLLAVPSSAPPEYLRGYLGPFRLLLSDLVVFTMVESPTAGPDNLLVLRSHVEQSRSDVRYVLTDLEPVPLGDVRGREAFFTTTASEAIASKQAASLEATSGCRVVGWSSRLADRSGLAEDLDRAEGYDVLLTELKAAAIDVACERALARGSDVVFVDNRPFSVEGEADLRPALVETLELAITRREGR